MTTVVTKENPITIPDALRRRAGIVPGDRVEIKASGGIITIVARSRQETAEYTPSQRRVIDTRLAEGLADIKAGRTFGPFHSADEMVADMKIRLRKGSPAKPTKRAR